MYLLTPRELARFIKAMRVAMAIPFIDDIEDFVVEAIWQYSKNIDGLDPLYNIRSKDLYDVVDTRRGIGWSVKSVQWSFHPECRFELVIQRADVYKKAKSLGFEKLNSNSKPDQIGHALLKHWEQKVINDAISQDVRSKRILILLKTPAKNKFAIYEDDLQLYPQDALYWEWTNEQHNGLKGILRDSGIWVYKWYQSQKQLFERFTLPINVQQFEVVPYRLTKEQLVEMISPSLPTRP